MGTTIEERQTLSILDAIEDNNRVTQRELSKATGLNLAKVNFLLRRLAEKGEVKLRNISRSPNRLRYLYALTPRGIAEKSRLTIRFAARTLREYSRTIELVQHNLKRLQHSGVLRVLLIGANDITRTIVDAAAVMEDLTIVGIVAPERSGQLFDGIPYVADAEKLSYDRAIPCDDVEIHSGEMARAAGIPSEKLWLM